MGQHKDRARDQLIQSVKRAGYDGRVVAKNVGVPYNTLKSRLRKHGLYLRPMLNLHSDEEILAVLNASGDLADAAKRMQMSRGGFRKALIRRKIRHPFTAGVNYKVADIPAEVLWKVYQDCLFSTVKASRFFGCSHCTLRRTMRNKGLTIVQGRQTKPWDEKTLRVMHHDMGMTMAAIAEAYDASPSGVRGAMARFRIPILHHAIGRKGSYHVKAPRYPVPQVEAATPTDLDWDCRPLRDDGVGSSGHLEQE